MYPLLSIPVNLIYLALLFRSVLFRSDHLRVYAFPLLMLPEMGRENLQIDRRSLACVDHDRENYEKLEIDFFPRRTL